MIQRIQSIYLVLAAIFSILVIFIPIGYITTPDFQYVYDAFAVKLNIREAGAYMSTVFNALLFAASGLMSVIIIFLYKNRKLQVRLISVNLILHLIALFVMLYVYPEIIFVKKGLVTDLTAFDFNPFIAISIIPPVLLYLASRAIKKDEKLVRATDRLR